MMKVALLSLISYVFLQIKIKSLCKGMFPGGREERSIESG